MGLLPVFVGILSLLTAHVMAATSQSMTIQHAPTTLDQGGEAEISVLFSCPTCTTDSFLRAVFYVSGTSYFGYTQKNDGTWVNVPGGSCTQYYKILPSDMSQEGTWSGVLKVKPDIQNAYYQGPGEYLLKIGRYTPSCSSASIWSNDVTVAITGPTATPTVVNTPTSAPTSTNSPTSAPSPTQTSLPTQVPTEAVSPTSADVRHADVLGDSVMASSLSTMTKAFDQSIRVEASTAAVPSNNISPFVISFLCIGTGMALLAVAFSIRQTDVWNRHRTNIANLKQNQHVH